ncbi:MAG TPA: HAD-IA family hydrolase [Polyangia bacterium]|jgi:pyrophosphatase PpaX
MPPYATCLFDLDGTLIDSVELILRSFRHTMLVHRGAAPDDAVFLAGLGTTLWDQFRTVAADAAEVEAMVATYRAFNLAHHDALVREYPGVRAAVRALVARGARLAIVTSKLRASAARGLALAGLTDAFPVIVGADDVAEHKPHPAPVRRALALLGADPAGAVFVGDSPHDIAAGRAAGVGTAAVTWGPFPRATLVAAAPDHWVAAPAELADLAPPAGG